MLRKKTHTLIDHIENFFSVLLQRAQARLETLCFITQTCTKCSLALLHNIATPPRSPLTSVAAASTARQATASAATEAAAGLSDLLAALASLASQGHGSAALTDGGAVVPAAATTCQWKRRSFNTE